jgi:hypothetical protein
MEHRVMADEIVEAVLNAAGKTPHRTYRDIAAWARRRRYLAKIDDANVEQLLTVIRAVMNGDGQDDDYTVRLMEEFFCEDSYEKVESLCVEVLELRKRMRKLGWDKVEPEPEQQVTVAADNPGAGNG